MQHALTTFCFSIDSLTGSDISEMIEAGLGFEPTRIRTDDFLKAGGSFSRRDQLQRLRRSRVVTRVRLETDKAEDGPYFHVITLPAWGLQVASWKQTGIEIPGVEYLNQLAANPGFNAGYRADAEDTFWQSEEKLSTYEVFGRSHAGLPKITDHVFGGEKVDIGRNPGRRSLFPGMWLQAAWQMWFGGGAFRYLSRERLLAFVGANRIVVLDSGSVFVELYGDWKACSQPESRRRQESFRKWTGMDELEAQAGDFGRGLGDPTFEIREGSFSRGGSRYLTQWLDAEGNPVRKSRAVKKVEIEASTDGTELWRQESSL